MSSTAVASRFDFLELLDGHAGAPAFSAIPWFECHIAGTMYRDEIETRLDELMPGVRLCLRREPENPHDALAIRFETLDGFHLGYVPRRLNPAPAKWLDDGGRLEAELLRISWVNHWLKLEARVDRLQSGEASHFSNA